VLAHDFNMDFQKTKVSKETEMPTSGNSRKSGPEALLSRDDLGSAAVT
jgi:hypothetical protein